jgi:hypothetical protein
MFGWLKLSQPKINEKYFFPKVAYMEKIVYLWVLLNGEPEAKINPKGMGKNL